MSVCGVLLGALVTGACATRTATPASAPVIVSLSPDQAMVANGAVVQVLVTGTGFDSLNTLHFGSLVIRGVPRTSPTTLRFTVPTDDTYLPNRGGAPLTPIAPGPYDVMLETTRGKSNVKVFTVRGAAPAEALESGAAR